MGEATGLLFVVETFGSFHKKKESASGQKQYPASEAKHIANRMLIVAQSIADGEWRSSRSGLVRLGTGAGVAAAVAFGSSVERFTLAGTIA